MSRWEADLHSEQPDRPVQLAFIHAELEAIHPFLDGNGRLGRLLVPLFLVEKKILSRPTFYISGYLEAHRDEYYERLLAVSRDHDWTGWAAFFAQGIDPSGRGERSKGPSHSRALSTGKGVDRSICPLVAWHRRARLVLFEADLQRIVLCLELRDSVHDCQADPRDRKGNWETRSDS